MVSIQRALKSEQTVLKHYSLKINRLRVQREKIVKPEGHVSF